MQKTTEHNNKEHWERIYQTKDSTQLSWYENLPATSLRFIYSLHLPKSARIFDNGAGDSYLVDNLLKSGYEHITVRDISETALVHVKDRLGVDADKVNWIVSDNAYCDKENSYDVWHDRAAFHFLTESTDIQNYVSTVKKCLKPGGYFIVGTFSDRGPKKCSGLPVRQYSEAEMENVLAPELKKQQCFTEDHVTPSGSKQNFLYCSFKKEE